MIMIKNTFLQSLIALCFSICFSLSGSTATQQATLTATPFTAIKSAAEENVLHSSPQFVSQFVQSHALKYLIHARESTYDRDTAYDALRKKTEAILAAQDSQELDDARETDAQQAYMKLKSSNGAAMPAAKDFSAKHIQTKTGQAPQQLPQPHTASGKKITYSCSLCDYITPYRCNAERHFMEIHIDGKRSPKDIVTKCAVCKAKGTNLRDHLKEYNARHLQIIFK